MKIPIVREWGSWVVFFSACLTALITGLMTRPWESGRDFANETVLAILGLAFLINSKNPLASLLRTGRWEKDHIWWLLFFSMGGLAFLLPFLIEGIGTFALFSLPVISYVVLLYMGREHSLFTELNGFALLVLSSPVVFFTITGELSLKLYAAVLLFFGAGVFKVRVRIRKSMKYRCIMVLYCVFSVIVYYMLDVSLIILIPLLENVVSVVLMREEKLRTTGYTELAKGVVFIILMGIMWKP